MATRKRASSRSRPTGLVGRAVRAGRKALRQAESRVPPDVRRQVERSIKDGQKTLKAAIDQLQVQIRKTAKQADVDKALKRLEGLSKQVQQIARNAATGAPARTARRTTSTAKRATARRKPATRKAPTRRSASSSPAAAAPKPRRAPVRRSPKPAAQTPLTPESSESPEWIDRGGSST
jgi:colicin import membrane protein